MSYEREPETVEQLEALIKAAAHEAAKRCCNIKIRIALKETAGSRDTDLTAELEFAPDEVEREQLRITGTNPGDVIGRLKAEGKL